MLINQHTLKGKPLQGFGVLYGVLLLSYYAK
jgi:hypothetical protein